MHLLLACAAGGPSDQERLDIHDQRPIARIPAAIFQKEIFSVLKAEKRESGKIVAVGVEAKHDRVFVLHPAEFRRHRQATHDIVAEAGIMVGVNAEVAMGFGGQDGVVRHISLSYPW